MRNRALLCLALLSPLSFAENTDTKFLSYFACDKDGPQKFETAGQVNEYVCKNGYLEGRYLVRQGTKVVWETHFRRGLQHGSSQEAGKDGYRATFVDGLLDGVESRQGTRREYRLGARLPEGKPSVDGLPELPIVLELPTFHCPDRKQGRHRMPVEGRLGGRGYFAEFRCDKGIANGESRIFQVAATPALKQQMPSLLFLGSLKNGKLDGAFKLISSGELWESGSFRQGILDGEFTRYSRAEKKWTQKFPYHPQQKTAIDSSVTAMLDLMERNYGFTCVRELSKSFCIPFVVALSQLGKGIEPVLAHLDEHCAKGKAFACELRDEMFSAGRREKILDYVKRCDAGQIDSCELVLCSAVLGGPHGLGGANPDMFYRKPFEKVCAGTKVPSYCSHLKAVIGSGKAPSREDAVADMKRAQTLDVSLLKPYERIHALAQGMKKRDAAAFFREFGNSREPVSEPSDSLMKLMDRYLAELEKTNGPFVPALEAFPKLESVPDWLSGGKTPAPTLYGTKFSYDPASKSSTLTLTETHLSKDPKVRVPPTTRTVPLPQWLTPGQLSPAVKSIDGEFLTGQYTNRLLRVSYQYEVGGKTQKFKMTFMATGDRWALHP